MTNEALEKYLSEQRYDFDVLVLNRIIVSKENAIRSKNEEDANYYWRLEQVFAAKAMFIRAFREVCSGDYESAWFSLAELEVLICELFTNSDTIWLKRFGVEFIKDIIPEYQKLFPYHLFLSREMVIKKERCSICGQEIKLRGGCKHRIGRLYMGSVCYAKVEEAELKAMAIVTNPFDKYALLKSPGHEFNYSILKKAMAKIHDPYQAFKVDKKYILNKEVEQKHTFKWLEAITRIDYSITING